MTFSPTTKPLTKGRALCVGINAYPGAFQLTGAVADALLWKSVLSGNGFDVTVLVDQDATRRAVLDALRSLTSSAAPGDALVFTFSGFGMQLPEPDTNGLQEEVLVPIDYPAGELLTDNDLADSIGWPAATLTAFIDCCFSGVGSQSPTQRQASADRDQRPRYIYYSPELQALFNARRSEPGLSIEEKRRSVVAFGAHGADGVAWERDGHGEFSRRAAALLAGGIPRLTNRDFCQRLLEAFGPTPLQTPELATSEALAGGPFLANGNQ